MLNISELKMFENIYSIYGEIPEDCAKLFCDDIYNIEDRYNIYLELFNKYLNGFVSNNVHKNNLFENLGGDFECTNFQHIDEYLSTIDYSAKQNYLNECLNNLNQFDNVLKNN